MDDRSSLHHLRIRQKSNNRSPSPSTNIDQLRRVLAGSPLPSYYNSLPKIEINGEKVISTSADSAMDLTPDEKEVSTGDLNLILESLKINSGRGGVVGGE